MSPRFLILALASACAAPTDVDVETSSLAAGSTVVALTFDDTFADNYQVGELAAARGMRATFYINSTRVDQPGYLTRTQLAALAAQGHEIGGHTLTHARLAELDEAEARRQICDDRVALLDMGFAVTSFAYPFSSQNALVRQIVADCGYNAGRLVGGLVTPGSCNGCPYANPVPPPDPFGLRTSDSVKMGTTLATLQQYVTQAEENGGGFVPIVFHHVCDGCDSLAVSPATLAAFLDWLAPRAANGTTVATVGEVIGGAVQPPVDGPPIASPPPPADGNLLPNPSLETDTNGDQVPDCWQRGGSGTSAATYSLVAGAFDGSVAQRIAITSYTSGARRLVSRQDSGACAPAVTAGHRYTVRAYYIADVQPVFTIYYRNASGTWVWFAQSPRLPASSTYVEGRYAIPPLPDDATAISVGLSLTSAGTLTMDAFALTDDDAGGTEPPPAGDTTPPTVRVAAPADGASVTGTVPIWADASDDVGVYRVRFYRDGVFLGSRVQTSYRWYWDTSTVAKGTHTLAVEAEDAAGNRTRSASITVTVY